MSRFPGLLILALVATPALAQPPGQPLNPFRPTGPGGPPRNGSQFGYSGYQPGFIGSGQPGFSQRRNGPQIGGLGIPGFPSGPGGGLIGNDLVPSGPGFQGSPVFRTPLNPINQMIDRDFQPGFSNPPKFDPSLIKIEPPRITLQQENLNDLEKPSHQPSEWPSWASWEWALGLLGLCVVGGYLRGRFSIPV